MSRVVLSLDIATITGWAVGRPGDSPKMGSVRLLGRGAEDGAIGCALIDWLADQITIHAPSLVAYEAPLQRGQHSGQAAGLVTIGLVMAVKIVCWRREVKCQPFHVSTIRANTVGSGRAKKADVAAWCASQGWQVPQVAGEPDLDATDAAALWAYACGWRAA
jgi:Holliday junction resolvasome RuvABC endonuclease subunit